MIDDAILGRSKLYAGLLIDVMLSISKVANPPPDKAREEILAEWIAASTLCQLATVLAGQAGLTKEDLEIYAPAFEILLATARVTPL